MSNFDAELVKLYSVQAESKGDSYLHAHSRNLAVIRRHERSIDRAILAGAEGPDHTLKLPGVVRSQFEVISQLYRTDPAAGPPGPL